MKNYKNNLNKKTEIAEIPEIPLPILEAASNGKLVVFIGAGVSRLLGYPSWQNLAERYAEYLYKEGYLSYLEYEHLKKLDPRKLLSICKNFCKKKDIPKPSISKLLHPKENEKDIRDIYELIYSWNVIYVTTNFDDELDKVAKKPRKDLTIENYNSSSNFLALDNSNVEIISDPEKILISHLYSSGNVIHLHGSLDSKKLILTISDYLYHYQHEKIQSFLNHLFTNFTVLFIGYGLEEYELLEFLVHKSQLHNSSHLKSEQKEIKYYLLYPVFSWEQAMLEFYQLYYEDLKIKLVPYKKDEKGYKQLYEVIKDWTPKIKNVVQPPGYLEIFKLIDEVVK
jgi:hypothetical protein